MIERLSYEDIAEIVDAHADAMLLFARQWSAAFKENDASLTPLERALCDKLVKEPSHDRR